jgi:hypothetical protein
LAAEKIKNCRPGNEQGEESNHHESDDARCLFGSDNDGHTCGLCTAGAGDAGGCCKARWKSTGRPSKLALVKVADGFHDPVGVTAAKDGSGRIFVVERAGRVRIVGKDGKVLPDPFIDLTNFNPLGSDVQTGFVEQGLWSVAFHPKFKDNGILRAMPFSGPCSRSLCRSRFRSMQLNFFSAPRVSLLALAVVGGTLGLSPATAGDLSDFKSPRDNSPMTFPLQTGEVEMPAVKNVKATGVNEYRGNVDAVADSSITAPAVQCSRTSAAACSRIRCPGLSPM